MYKILEYVDNKICMDCINLRYASERKRRKKYQSGKQFMTFNNMNTELKEFLLKQMKHKSINQIEKRSKLYQKYGGIAKVPSDIFVKSYDIVLQHLKLL